MAKVWFGSACVLVSPSPKSHWYDESSPSGSLDPSPVMVQTRSWQSTDIRAVGGWLVPPPSAAAYRNIARLDQLVLSRLGPDTIVPVPDGAPFTKSDCCRFPLEVAR